jgi:hypothetical protein
MRDARSMQFFTDGDADADETVENVVKQVIGTPIWFASRVGTKREWSWRERERIRVEKQGDREDYTEREREWVRERKKERERER